ncbi:fungal-specific transcription factor domain-containing protein [Phellopilus nigrolimitatus]|nr:fungal-specific transcription factor domain-containing protein [Phellopilus nigrolimitatus]
MSVASEDDDRQGTPGPLGTNEEIGESKASAAASAAAAAPPKERRFKLSRACDRCRRRRIKCDEGHPCQSCLAATSACTFEEPGKRTHPHKSKRAATLEDRMHHLESLIQSIPFSLFGAQQGAPASPALQNNALSIATTNGASAGYEPPSPSPAADPTSPHASFARATHAYPLGVPPPSLSRFPLMNPSTHFPVPPAAPAFAGASHARIRPAHPGVSPSYLYLDDEGYTRWQGETSGLPLLDFLVERELPAAAAAAASASASASSSFDHRPPSPVRESWSRKSERVTTGDWFPDRTPRVIAPVHPETMWRLITSMIPPELMDALVQCFLSTTYYLMPFLHVPTFLADYGNPAKWGEPGFAAFVVAVCCLSARHIDDVRVRADPADGVSAGAHWFELFAKLRTMPAADRPSLYAVQAVFVAGVYAVGLGRLSRGFALLAEAVTLAVDAGLHRSSEAYDCFGPVEEQVRRRTFWCVYVWDKQAAAAFGRPALLRLRDCDAPEPAAVDDEHVSAAGAGPQPPGVESRLGAFVACVRVATGAASPFLARAAGVLAGGPLAAPREKDLRAEEALLDDVLRALPSAWAHTAETMASADVLRVTQAERLHCLEQFVRMLIQRHRFSRRVAKKGLMTYYGVHVIHQLTQAGRTLIAVLLTCRAEDLQGLVPPSLEALRACVGLLRRFSGRYICGLRSGELIEEFCRLTRIPLDAPEPHQGQQDRPPWIRPVRKKTRAPGANGGGGGSSESSGSRHGSPEGGAASLRTCTITAAGRGGALGLDPRVGNGNGNGAFGEPLDLGGMGGLEPMDALGPIGVGGMGVLGEMGGMQGMGEMGEMGAMGGLSSTALMTLLNDGSFDMNALFSADYGSPASAAGSGAGTTPMTGVVASP